MKKNKSSKDWIIKQHRDQYFKQAKSSGFRSRSAYKLLELNKKFNIFSNCKTVIDLGCYPGGWSQILKKNLKNCKILSVDIKEMEKIDGIDFLCCDFQKKESKEKILKKLNSKADLLVSDMAADTTGNKDLDCIRTNQLCLEVLKFAKNVLKSNGVVVSKVFMGEDFEEVKDIGKNHFKKINFFKPKSSRNESKETYIHCVGLNAL